MQELENITELEISYIDGKVEKVKVSSYEVSDYILEFWVDSYDYDNDVIVLKTTIPLSRISKIKELS